MKMINKRKRYKSLYESSEKNNMKMLMDEIDKLFLKIKQQMFDKHVKSFTNNAETILERYKEKKAKGDLTNKRNKTQSFHNYIANSPYRKLYKIDEVQGNYGKNIETIPELIPNYKIIINQMAEETVESYIETYKTRLSVKMYLILKSKRLINIELVDVYFKEQIHAIFKFKFDEGQFDIKSQVVFVINQYDTAFSRFPYTFHNVKYPNGDEKKKDSLENIEKGFLQKDLGDLENIENIKKTDKEKKKILGQNQRKLKSQVSKALGIIDQTKNPEIIKINFKLLLEKRNVKWIESLNFNKKIEVSIKKKNPDYKFDNDKIIFNIPSGTIGHIVYKDNTEIKFEIEEISNYLNYQSAVIVKNKKIKGNINFDFYNIRGKIIEVINQGFLTTEIQTKI